MSARIATSLLLGLTLLAVSASPASAVKVRRSADAMGVSVNGLVNPAGRARSIADSHVPVLDASGIAIGRTDAYWTWVEPREPKDGKHRWTWEKTDNVAELLARAGVRWLPILGYSAPWAASIPGNDKSAPRSNAEYAAYAAAVVDRYGRDGSFWKKNPQLPYLPATHFEVWNEPNLHVFWQPAPDPRRYGSLYAVARDAIHRADPQAVAVMAGMSPYATPFLDAMYAARPSLRGNVDAFAYHPYAADAPGVLRLVRGVRRKLDELGEEDRPLWITEVGWPTQGEGGLSADALPDATRAANMSLVGDALLGSNCAIQRFSPYTWATPERDPEHDEEWLGLFRPDTTATEAGSAYLAVISRNATAAKAPPALALDVCADRGTVHAESLRLGIALTNDTQPGCYLATVTYRGRPLNGVRVTFETGRVREKADTDANGQARVCMRRGAGATVEASAVVWDVAASRTAELATSG